MARGPILQTSVDYKCWRRRLVGPFCTVVGELLLDEPDCDSEAHHLHGNAGQLTQTIGALNVDEYSGAVGMAGVGAKVIHESHRCVGLHSEGLARR